MTNTKITLTESEKSLLWKKIETRKKKSAIETKNSLYEFFNGDKTEFASEEVTTIVKSLEYTFKKKLLTSPTLDSTLTELVQKIKSVT